MKKTTRTKSGKGIKNTISKKGIFNSKPASMVTFQTITPYKTKNGQNKSFVKETTYMWVDSRKTSKNKGYVNTNKRNY